MKCNAGNEKYVKEEELSVVISEEPVDYGVSTSILILSTGDVH